MAIRQDDSDDAMTEYCDTCGRTTPHDVTIQLLTESHREENAEFSREPYRVSAYRLCDAERSVRMNNA